MAVDIQYSWTTRIASTSQSNPYVLMAQQYFVVFPASRHFPFSRDFVVSAVSRHFWLSTKDYDVFQFLDVVRTSGLH